MAEAEYEIQAQDGRKFVVTAPESMSESDVLDHFRSSMPAAADHATTSQPLSFPKPSPTQSGLPALPGGYQAPPQPNAMARMGRGMMDVYQGTKQKYLNWTDPEAAASYTQGVNADAALYEEGRGPDAGYDWMRLFGNVATPMSVIPGGPATVAGRMVVGAVVGGAIGYVLFNPDNTPASNAVRTGIGTVGGAILNVAIPPAVQAASRKVNELWRLGMQRISPAVRTTIASNVDDVLSKKGINLKHLSDDVQQSIYDDAAEQLSKHGTFDVEQLARKADIEAVAGPGMATKAQISRTPQQWTAERNLQKMEVNLPDVQSGKAATLTQRYQAQDAAAKEYAAQLSAKISGRSASDAAQTPMQASERTISALRKADKEAERAVTELYEVYHSMGAEGTPVPDVGIADTLGRVVDDFGPENIPSAVLARLKEFGFMGGERTKLLTIQEADKLSRLINNNNPGFGPTSKALSLVKNSINESLLEVPVEGGSSVQVLLQARAAAAERFAAQRTTKAIEQAIGDVAPDRFFETHILRGNARDIAKLGERLPSIENGSFAWNDLRSQTWEWIINKASQDGLAPLNGTKLSQAIKSIGPERMKALFTPSEMAEMKTMERATLAMTREPAYAAPNRSNTSPSLVGQVLRFANKIPMLNIMTEPTERAMATSANQRALSDALAGKMTPAPQPSASNASLRVGNVAAQLPASAVNLQQQGSIRK